LTVSETNADGASVRELLVIDLGLVDYDQAHVFQRAAARLRARNAISQDLLILCEHPAVVTMGRATKSGNLLATAAELDAHVVQLRDVERGGDVTVHEPGQLVGYPILQLSRHRQDLHWYLRQLEEALIQTLDDVGLAAGRQPGQTGVWIDHRKLASIGVHAREWVTSHGFALNAHNTLGTFQWVVPCGIQDVVMTTVARECQTARVAVPTAAELRGRVTERVASAFALAARTASHDTVSAIRAEMLPVAL
jgi:lipoate-protein ligase B